MKIIAWNFFLNMANISSSRKRARQAQKRRQHNVGLRSRYRTCVKKALQALASDDREAADEAYRKASSVLDSSVGKKLLHKNKAARYKHSLNRRLRTMP